MAKDTTLVRAVTASGTYDILRTVELPGSDWKPGDEIALVDGKWATATGTETIRAKITEIVDGHE